MFQLFTGFIAIILSFLIFIQQNIDGTALIHGWLMLKLICIFLFIFGTAAIVTTKPSR
jgi:hypothetical protein